jgi:hypothetical protein
MFDLLPEVSPSLPCPLALKKKVMGNYLFETKYDSRRQQHFFKHSDILDQYFELKSTINSHSSDAKKQELAMLQTKCIQNDIWTKNQFFEADLVSINLSAGNQFLKLPFVIQQLFSQHELKSTFLLNTTIDYLIHIMPQKSLYASLFFDHDNGNDTIWYRVDKLWK